MSLIPIPASADPDVKESFRKLNVILERLTGGNNVDWHGRRIINAGKAINPGDYVTLEQVEEITGAVAKATAPASTPVVGVSGGSSGGSPSGGGNVSHIGPIIDNAIARFVGTTGENIEAGSALLEDDGRISGVADPDGLQDVATKNYVDESIADLNAGGAAQNTFLVSGGQVVWQTAYTFLVSAAVYYINGVLHSSPETTISLDSSDAALDRIDIIAVDDSGSVIKLTGTAAAQPAEPDVDPSTQLKLAIVLVTATSTQPTTATSVSVYAENAGSPGEWNWTTSGSGWTLGSTNNPHLGSKDIEATNVASGAYLQAQTGSGTIDPSSYDQLVLFIRSKANWTNNRTLQVRLQNSGSVVGQTITVGQGQFGFDSTQTSLYQQVAIPITSFAVPSGTPVNQIRITRAGNSTIGFYIDDVSFVKSGGTQVVTGITQAQADARYAPLGPSFVTVSAESGLPNERRLTAGAGISLVDAGANNTIEVIVKGVTGVDDGNSGTALTIDFASALFGRHELTLTDDVTLTLDNPADKGCYAILIDTGVGGFTVTWPASVLWAGGVAPVITPTAGKVDLVTLIYRVSTGKYHGSFNQNY